MQHPGWCQESGHNAIPVPRAPAVEVAQALAFRSFTIRPPTFACSAIEHRDRVPWAHSATVPAGNLVRDCGRTVAVPELREGDYSKALPRAGGFRPESYRYAHRRRRVRIRTTSKSASGTPTPNASPSARRDSHTSILSL